jgi:Bacterial regulatory proteins, tetR family
MDAIAQEAGVSKATLYSYYRDKASLFAGVMHRMCDELAGDDVRGLVGGQRMGMHRSWHAASGVFLHAALALGKGR